MLYQFEVILIVLLVMVISSCDSSSYYADSNFFKDENGIIVGDPIKNDDGTWFLPIQFETRILHSAKYVDGVDINLKDNIITIRAIVTYVQKGRKPSFFKGANLGKLPNGTYQVRYLNNDKSTVDICKIEIRN